MANEKLGGGPMSRCEPPRGGIPSVSRTPEYRWRGWLGRPDKFWSKIPIMSVGSGQFLLGGAPRSVGLSGHFGWGRS